MDCKELKEMFDSYISDELLVETNHGVLRHLEKCSDCRRELSDRRNLTRQIRRAVKGSSETQLDPVFASRVTRQLRDTAMSTPAWQQPFGKLSFLNAGGLAVSFGVLVIALFAGYILLKPALRPEMVLNDAQPVADSSMPGSDILRAIRASWQELASHAVGDHENCAIEFRLKEKPISLDEAARDFGPFSRDLDTVVKAALKTDGYEDTKFVEAHSCLYEGRRFTHIVLKHKGELVSLLVTGTDLPAGSDEIQTAQFDGSNVAGFNVSHHAVFVVSDLSAADNISLARQVAPAIRRHTEDLGA